MADLRHARAPPPTPIATGKGSRSAAVDDRILAEFLATLKVPDLTLPDPFPARPTHRAPAEVDLPSLIARDAASVRRMLASAAVVGAFRVDGRSVVTSEEVRGAVEAGKAAFGIPEGKRRDWFGTREGVGEEFYWDWRRSLEIEKAVGKVWSGGTYRSFRERMESLASKLEMIAQCLQRTLLKHIKDHRQLNRRIRSILCIRKYDPRFLGGDCSEAAEAKHDQCHALILHLYGDDQNFCIPAPDGPASSGLPSASILVTVDEQLQEWCNDAFKSPSEDIFYEPSFATVPSSSSSGPGCKDGDSVKTITLMDQLFIMLTVSFLYRICACIFFKFV